MENQKPLVSILSVVKNGAYTIRRCVESVLCQDYSNIEFIIQDGASTDGTLEVVQEYAQRHPGRIKIVSEPDSSGGEAFFRALKRCTGDIIGSCLSDEELLPHAVSWAVEQFERHPDAGAVYGDYYTTDIDGNVTKENRTVPFDLCAYLCHEIVPPFAASFFLRNCFEQVGLEEHRSKLNAGEFVIWVKIGLFHPILYVPGFVAKFGVHPDSNTSKPSIVLGLIHPRIRLMKKLFTGSEKCQCHTARSQRNHRACRYHAWLSLKVNAKQLNKTLYQVKTDLLRDYLRAELCAIHMYRPFSPHKRKDYSHVYAILCEKKRQTSGIVHCS